AIRRVASHGGLPGPSTDFRAKDASDSVRAVRHGHLYNYLARIPADHASPGPAVARAIGAQSLMARARRQSSGAQQGRPIPARELTALAPPPSHSLSAHGIRMAR